MDVSGNISTYSATIVEDAIPAPELAAVSDSAHGQEPDREPVAASALAGWSPLTRLGFRICFIYFCCIIYLYGDFSVLFTNYLFYPRLSSVLTWPLNHLGVFAGRHIFHIHDLRGDSRVTIPGDALINWVLDRVFLGAAVIGGLIWTAIAYLRRSQRTEYETLLAWIRFFLRLTVAFFMVAYGMIKVFPLQMPALSTPMLNQPLGRLSPHLLLWSLLGLYPLYEIICGAAEVLSGTLLLFRRTALAGALLSIFLLSNVVMYNFFFGVELKLFALNLLLASIFLVVPDTKPLLDFFWYRRPSIPANNWAPKSMHWGVRAYVRMLEIVFIFTSLIVIPYCNGAIWNHYRQLANFQSPLRGVWKLDDPQAAKDPFKTPKVTATEFSVERADAGILFFPGSGLTRVSLEINQAAHTIRLNTFTYRWELLDEGHLVLTAVPPKPPIGTGGNSASSPHEPNIITLTRVPTPHYRLLEYPFQWIVFR